MPPSIRNRLIAGVALALLCLLTAAYALQRLRAEPPLDILGQVPAFELLERSGEAFASSSLQNQVWIANFIFTRCEGPCPLMSSQMAQLQKELSGAPDVRFVSFSVDPLADTPEVLREYAERYQASSDRWLFLTGGVKELYSLIEGGFKLQTGPMPDLETVGPGDLIIHTTRFVLIDGSSRIRGYYDSEAAGFHAQLLKDVDRLRRSES